MEICIITTRQCPAMDIKQCTNFNVDNCLDCACYLNYEVKNFETRIRKD